MHPGDVIGSFGKHRYTIYFKIEGFSVFIFFINEANSTQSYPVRLLGYDFIFYYDLSGEIIQGGLSSSIRHPTYGDATSEGMET